MKNDESSIKDEPEKLEPASPPLDGLPLQSFVPGDVIHTPPEYAITETDVHPLGGAELVSGSSLWRDAWRRLLKNKLAVFGMVVVIVITLASIFGPLTIKATTGITPDYIPSNDVKRIKSFPPFTGVNGEFSWAHPM